MNIHEKIKNINIILFGISFPLTFINIYSSIFFYNHQQLHDARPLYKFKDEAADMLLQKLEMEQQGIVLGMRMKEKDGSYEKQKKRYSDSMLSFVEQRDKFVDDVVNYLGNKEEMINEKTL